MSDQSLEIAVHRAPFNRPFTISRGSKTHAETVRVSLTQGSHSGRGECVPYGRYGETVETVTAAIEAVRAPLEAGVSPAELQSLMPAGAARYAVDAALWNLTAKRTGRPVWQHLGLSPPRPIETAETVSLDTAEAMATAARAIKGTLLKLKLGGPEDLHRIAAVHAARPDARLIVDGNEGIPADQLASIAGEAAELGVVLIEQPLPASADDALERGRFPVPICADESAHTADDIPALAERYDAVNVKLDKAGGLTAALAMVAAAKAEGLVTMVGCMAAGSLSMAPAILAAQDTDYADLDGPLWLAEDEAPGLNFRDGWIHPAEPALWG